MVRVLPFSGIHFDWKRVSLSRALCPPYDVIEERLARRLRRRRYNAIQVELPAGGPSVRYRRAVLAWRRWRAEGVLTQDVPSYYVVEQRFRLGARRYRRTGLLAALGLDAASLRRVLRHERTLPKPKKDRRRLLAALRVNTSPIFTVFPDAGGKVRRLLSGIARARPCAMGQALDGTGVRVWAVREPGLLSALRGALGGKRLLVADGHHRLEVAKRSGADAVLCYLCAEEDPGLVVLPTHRVLPKADGVRRLLPRLCRLTSMPGLGRLVRSVERHRSPYAFGLVSREGCALGAPTAVAERGMKSGLGVEWLSRRLLRRVDPQDLRYTHDASEAAAWARASGGLAVLVKPFPARLLRRAAARAGLLPQKSTYFHPKVGAGIVFRQAFFVQWKQPGGSRT